SPALLVFALALPGAACHSKPTSSADAPFKSVAEQVEHGREVFASSCARCHGDAGQGGRKAPPLVGSAALPLNPRPEQKRAQPFRTALDVAHFVTTSMPPDEDDRKKLLARDDWAVLAFALSANGITFGDPVGPENAAHIVLHP